MDNAVRRHYRHIEVQRIAGALGAEIRGVDIAQPRVTLEGDLPH